MNSYDLLAALLLAEDDDAATIAQPKPRNSTAVGPSPMTRRVSTGEPSPEKPKRSRSRKRVG